MDTNTYSYDDDLVQKIERIEFEIWGNGPPMPQSKIESTLGIIPNYDNQEPKR